MSAKNISALALSWAVLDNISDRRGIPRWLGSRSDEAAQLVANELARDVLGPDIATLTAERDEAIRQRDEARALVREVYEPCWEHADNCCREWCKGCQAGVDGAAERAAAIARWAAEAGKEAG